VACATNAVEWQGHKNVNKFLHFSSSFLLNDKYFHVMTDALSHDKARIFKNGTFHIEMH